MLYPPSLLQCLTSLYKLTDRELTTVIGSLPLPFGSGGRKEVRNGIKQDRRTLDSPAKAYIWLCHHEEVLSGFLHMLISLPGPFTHKQHCHELRSKKKKSTILDPLRPQSEGANSLQLHQVMAPSKIPEHRDLSIGRKIQNV